MFFYFNVTGFTFYDYCFMDIMVLLFDIFCTCTISALKTYLKVRKYSLFVFKKGGGLLAGGVYYEQYCM